VYFSEIENKNANQPSLTHSKQIKEISVWSLLLACIQTGPITAGSTLNPSLFFHPTLCTLFFLASWELANQAKSTGNVLVRHLGNKGEHQALSG
jgi:hypothetical protein